MAATNKTGSLLLGGIQGILNMGDRFDLYPYKNKKVANLNYIKQYLNRTLRMFTWSGLDDIKYPYTELFQQLYGYAVLLNCEGKYYITPAVFGGECDPYYLPKEIIVANPWANNIEGFNGTHVIGEDCVLLKNDSNIQGLYQIINRFTSLLVENDISMLNTNIISRIVALMSVKDDPSRIEAERYLKRIIDGEFAVMANDDWTSPEAVQAQPLTATSNAIMQEQIELQQYLKGALAHELGINYAFNMKREAINSAESELNSEYLVPMIEDMLECRKQFCEDAYNVFGIEIDCELNSVWATNKNQADMQDDIIEAELEQMEAQAEKADAEAEKAAAEAEVIDDPEAASEDDAAVPETLEPESETEEAAETEDASKETEAEDADESEDEENDG